MKNAINAKVQPKPPFSSARTAARLKRNGEKAEDMSGATFVINTRPGDAIDMLPGKPQGEGP